MLSSICILSTLCVAALAAPTLTYSEQAAEPAEMKVLGEYFQMLGHKVQAGKDMSAAPVCDMKNAVLPVASPTPLPPPSAGLVLKHVAIGRGTQNYSCSTNATAAPVSIGAVATLFNASCVASAHPDLLSILPNVALQFNLSSTSEQKELTPGNLAVSGHHLFTNNTTPFFNLTSSNDNLGLAPCRKNNTVNAPTGAPVGQNNQGHGSVAWLKLVANNGATGNLQEIYRVNTAGGNPPATCAGMPAIFEVQYAAEYWFWETNVSEPGAGATGDAPTKI